MNKHTLGVSEVQHTVIIWCQCKRGELSQIWRSHLLAFYSLFYSNTSSVRRALISSPGYLRFKFQFNYQFYKITKIPICICQHSVEVSEIITISLYLEFFDCIKLQQLYNFSRGLWIAARRLWEQFCDNYFTAQFILYNIYIPVPKLGLCFTSGLNPFCPLMNKIVDFYFLHMLSIERAMIFSLMFSPSKLLMPIVIHKGDLEKKIKLTIPSTIIRFLSFLWNLFAFQGVVKCTFQIWNISNEMTPYSALTVLSDYKEYSLIISQ